MMPFDPNTEGGAHYISENKFLLNEGDISF